ncbi:LamG-like jellyroll fold domain-containing protein [Lentzea sp. CA-135723]|uniref:LamG domain-containing protein n=1 Tax=Lentzea sp. CA-135723 TaxID=3239950 RepID=UPI003D8FCC3E
MRRLFGIGLGLALVAQGVLTPVALAAPDAPVVSSSVYKTSGCDPEGCGGVGVEDTFVFSSSVDVVKFRWGFTDPPSTEVAAGVPVRWAPETGGPKMLYVEAFDGAGVSTRTLFEFTVKSPSPQVADWFAGDDPSFDGTGNGHDLALSAVDTARAGRTLGGAGAIGFDGVTSSATTGKVLDTTRGLTVSAWVRLGDGAVDRTVVSQQGTVESAFRLGFDAGTQRWTFAVAEKDAAGSAQRTVRSKGLARVGVWTHVAGTYDDASGEVRLYVDGVVQENVPVVKKGFSADGELWIGKALRGGTAAEAWQGDLMQMLAWNRAITAQEVRRVAVGIEVGDWTFNEGNGKTAIDSSPYARDLRLNGATWAPAYAGFGLGFGGTGSASSGEAVLCTDQSFTVDVWARLDAAGPAGTVVTQRGPSGVDPFTLRYDGVRWSAEMPDAAVNPAKVWRAKADAVAGTWTHLVATYDANARTLSLEVGYRDAAEVQKSTVARVSGWNSDGVLTVGQGFVGGVDELEIVQGPRL